jgi:hypothetical protein
MTMIIQDQALFINAQRIAYEPASFKLTGSESGHRFEQFKTVNGTAIYGRANVLKEDTDAFGATVDIRLTKEYLNLFKKLHSTQALVKVEYGSSFNYQCYINATGLVEGQVVTISFLAA